MRQHPKVRTVIVLIPFQLPDDKNSELWPTSSFIELDKESLVKKKLHELVYQQGTSFGQTGDRCQYLTHEQLFELEKLGYIKIN